MKNSKYVCHFTNFDTYINNIRPDFKTGMGTIKFGRYRDSNDHSDRDITRRLDKCFDLAHLGELACYFCLTELDSITEKDICNEIYVEHSSMWSHYANEKKSNKITANGVGVALVFCKNSLMSEFEKCKVPEVDCESVEWGSFSSNGKVRYKAKETSSLMDVFLAKFSGGHMKMSLDCLRSIQSLNLFTRS